MLIFRNPGEIDIAAVTTMGVSVKNAGSFGFFGTGLKFSIATILRNGGEVSIWSGLKRYTFRTKEKVIRGEVFQMVTMNGKELGFTTQLGRNWEAWMVFREVGCNCKDEDGEFFQFDESGVPPIGPVEGTTLIKINWPSLDLAYNDRATIFAEGEVLLETPELRIRFGTSDHVFYRGVRVSKLEGTSPVTYDIQSEQKLTEDRTLAYSWAAPALIRNTLLVVEDRALLRAILSPEAAGFEAKLNFAEDGAPDPSLDFVNAVLDARDAKDKHLVPSAKAAIEKLNRKEYVSSGGGYDRLRHDNLNQAISALKFLGFKDVETQVTVIGELPNEQVFLFEGGRVFVTPDISTQTPRDIALTIGKALLEEECWSASVAINKLLPLLLDCNTSTRVRQELPADFIAPAPEPVDVF